LFQGYDDPERFYWVACWPSRELYLAGVPSGAADDWLNDVCEDTLERAFFTPLDTSDQERGAAVSGGALVTLDATGAAARAAGDHLVDQPRGDTGVTAVSRYRGLDDPGQYLWLYGWESEAAQQRFYAETLPRYEAMLREHSRRVEPFVERTLAEVDRYPREPHAARPPIRAGQTPTD
jgi:heme-degrading monooxygenase HmoA